MFTGRTVPLRDFDGRFGLTVLRDCLFAFVGKIPTRLEARMVPCGTPRHIEQALAANGIAGIVTRSDLAESVPSHFGLAVAKDPILAVLLLQEGIVHQTGFQWESFESRIHATATIHAGAYIAPYDVEIGEGSIIHPNAVVLPRSIIGMQCSVGPGTIVGAEAFEVNIATSPRKIVTQSGGVRLFDNVDVQAACTLVRSTFGGFTELNEDTKLDCQVHLAHDCLVGKRVRIAACAEISGRVEIGDDAFIGPNASISNGIRVGQQSQVTIGAVVTRDVPDGSTVSGNFAIDHAKWLAFMKSVR